MDGTLGEMKLERERLIQRGKELLEPSSVCPQLTPPSLLGKELLEQVEAQRDIQAAQQQDEIVKIRDEASHMKVKISDLQVRTIPFLFSLSKNHLFLSLSVCPQLCLPSTTNTKISDCPPVCRAS